MTELARLEERSIDSWLVVRVQGEVDASNADAVADRIALMLDGAAPGLVVDLSETRYLDSAGIRNLFRLKATLEASGRPTWIAAPAGSPTRQVLDLAEVTQIIPVADSAEQAVRSMQRV